MRQPDSPGNGSVARRRRRWRRAVAPILTGAIAATMLTACGGAGGASDVTAGNFASKLTDEPITLRFIWFEWPPAHALEKLANEHYKKVRPNVTVEVNTVPIAQWHDAIFTQFAARKTNFDVPILDSQYIGEAVTNGNILELTDFVDEYVDRSAYNPSFLSAYGQYPRSTTGEADPDAKMYGLPLMGDTWAMVWRKDLMKEPPADWDDMIAKAAACQRDHPGMTGLAFQQASATDGAATPYAAVSGAYGGRLWDAAGKQVEGVINDAAGHQAMRVLVEKMKPLTAKGSGSWFIDEVNATVNQGKTCYAFQWIGAMPGLLDPEQSTLGKTRAEIAGKLGFAALPKGKKSDAIPLGGMGMHVSKYADSEAQAEALNFMKWFQSAEVQREWAELGGIPGRTDVVNSPEFLEIAPYNKAFTDSLPRLRDFWNLPEYAKLMNILTTNVNAALTGIIAPDAALNKIAREQQAVLDQSR